MKNYYIVCLIAMTINVFAYYDPEQGRWLSRDPLGFIQPATDEDDDDFSAHAILKAQKNVYTFVDNSPVGHFDALGLLKFKDCSVDDQRKAASAWSKACDSINRSSDFKCCFGNDNGLDSLRQKCKDPNFIIECDRAGSFMCHNSCGWAKWWGGVIHICPDGFTDPLCGNLECTIIHEMTHTTLTPLNSWPAKVEKCLGCK